MKAKQIQALFFLLLFVFQSGWPTAAMALTDKGTQPEFASYEDVDTSEMVNLMTGNFAYGLPAISVPSPEGSFDMALGYHAGIQMDEESSWVGLGWSLNPGAMDRNISIYPDDYDGSQVINSYATVLSASGNGWRKTRFVYWSAYSTDEGKSNGVQLGSIIGYSNDASGVGGNIIGITKDKYGWSFNVDRFFRSIQEVGMMCAGPAKGASALVKGAWYLFNAGIVTAQVIDAIADAKAAKTGRGNYAPGLRVNSSREGFGPWSKDKYNYWYEGPSNKKELGVLYLGNIPHTPNFNAMPASGNGELVFNGPAGTWGGAAAANQPEMIGNVDGGPHTHHDYFVYYDPQKELTNQRYPNSIAYDGFSIKGAGISGAISPYRLDAGSLAGTVLSEATQHYSFNMTPFLKNKNTLEATGYKVPFRYLGDPSNSYDYCLTRDAGGQMNTNFSTDWNYQSSNYFQVSIFDPKIQYGRGAGTGKEGDRSSTDPAITTKALSGDKIVHRRHIDWFSNQEIINGQTNNFLDCGISRTSFPANGIGGFSVTREDGMTYHFTIPVYNKTEYNKVYISTGPDTYKSNNPNPYATTWLLTGITGADFIDRGTPGRIDDADWGYWVKLDYGMYNNNYSWRSPYSGYDVSKDNTQSFIRGTKQTYYLNTIKTRSHTAIFQKSVKNDSRSYYESDGEAGNPAESETGDIVLSSVSNGLKLDNIYILNNADANTLLTTHGLSKLNQNYNNALNWANTWDNIDANVILASDFSPAANSFVTANQVNRIAFDYTYDLCKYAPNSWAVGGATPTNGAFGSYSTASCTGKLTLKAVHMLGPNNDRYTPSYEFDYNETTAADNPNYSGEMQDDMGMYKSSNANGYSGTVQRTYLRNCTPDGSQWSLKRITTPLGATMDINYERDTYSGVNGKSNGWYPLTVDMMKVGSNIIQSMGSNTFRILTHPRFGNVNQLFEVGNLANIRGLVSSPISIKDFNFLISALDPAGAYIEFTTTDATIISKINSINTNGVGWPRLIAVTGLNATSPRYAGDLRVKSIVTTDELGNQYASQYDYHNSGVASFEPPSNVEGINANEKLFDHPMLPIMYGQVTVAMGRINNGAFERNLRSVYKFITPDEQFLTVDEGGSAPLSGLVTNTVSPNTLGGYHTEYNNAGHNFSTGIQHMKFRARSAHMIVKDKTNQIGQLVELTNYNNRDEPLTQVKYQFTDGDNGTDYLGTQTEWLMGNYGETNFAWEYFNDPVLSKIDRDNGNNTHSYYNNTYRLFQTSKIKYPCVLKSYTMKNGMVSTEKNYTQWDYFTGMPIETVSRVGGPSMDDYTMVTVPAYSIYSEMGSKVMNPTYKNIMVANAQETQYVNTRNYVLYSNVTTWSKDVKYRLYNVSTAKYESAAFPYASMQLGPYHPQCQYVWKSAVEKNGLVLASNMAPFNWTAGASQDARWVKTSEATLYNTTSHLLEGLNINSKPLSSKFLNGALYGIASAPNCSYGEWCFSGAEDNPGAGNESAYFGGEVAGTQYRWYSANGSLAHTGSYSLKVPVGSNGFSFRGNFGGTADFKPGRKYRAAVWMHGSNLNGRLSVQTANSTTSLSYNEVNIPTGSVKEQYGNWYLLNFDFTMPGSMAGTSPYVFVRCYNAGATGFVYFDDFRVQPLDAPLEINVVDLRTGDVIASLDEENIATKYYFDNTHFCTRIEKETKDGFKRMVDHSRGFKR